MSDQPQRTFSTAFKESVVFRVRAGERLALRICEGGEAPMRLPLPPAARRRRRRIPRKPSFDRER